MPCHPPPTNAPPPDRITPDGVAPDRIKTVRNWLLSIIALLLLAILTLILTRGRPRPVPHDEPSSQTQSAIVAGPPNQPEIIAADETTTSLSAGSKPAPGDQPPSAASEPPPLIPGITLPQLPTNLVTSDGPIASPDFTPSRASVRVPIRPEDEAAILAEDAKIPREKIPTGPTAQLSLFGSPPAVGRSFVFVIDRSASMGGEGLGAIHAAAKELASKLDQLTSDQTFQVVAYNQSADYLTKRELIPATSENKRELVQFVQNLAAFGQTEHSRGLLSALRLKPEVIFLLTDGGDPVLNPAQLQTIRQEAAGHTAIHCLHFGRGPGGPAVSPANDEPTSFLARLAAENRGSYIYIDMTAR